MILACLAIGIATGIVLVTQKSASHVNNQNTSVTVTVRPPCTAVSWGWRGWRDNPYYYVDANPWIVPNVTAIASGTYHDVAITEDGSVVGWGVYRQPGSQNLTNVIAVAGGAMHSLALKDDGTVVAWGENKFDQCNVPEGLTNVTAISAGEDHSLALKQDGTVVAWGTNHDGQCNIPKWLTNVVAIFRC